jgi:hypothetical protein
MQRDAETHETDTNAAYPLVGHQTHGPQPALLDLEVRTWLIMAGEAEMAFGHDSCKENRQLSAVVTSL